MKQLSIETQRMNVPKWMKFRDRPENANFNMMFVVNENGVCNLSADKSRIYAAFKMQTRGQISPIEQVRNIVPNSNNETTQP